ncbi:MAG TPA: calcium/sodium antiporter [Anaerolineae bacterium]|nr:calcium/sodium antiporter [Anaerolineae bacterium]
MIPVFFIIIGAALLIKGADLLVDGGVGLALKSGISHLVVGLTVVAFGTSAPELAASMVAAFKGAGDICFGNVVGSNVANIALILGVTTLIRPISVNRLLIRWEIPFMILITVVTYYIGLMQFVGRGYGIGLLILFGVYLIHCMKSPQVTVEVEDVTARKKYATLVSMVVLGIVGLGVGGLLFVYGARDIARALGVSEAVIGLTVVALGTSLPELITSVIASFRGHSDISLGNIVGSNIFNILLVIGATATIQPYTVSPDRYLTMVGMPMMMALAVLILPFSMTGNRINRAEGALFFLCYTVYCVLAILMA